MRRELNLKEYEVSAQTDRNLRLGADIDARAANPDVFGNDAATLVQTVELGADSLKQEEDGEVRKGRSRQQRVNLVGQPQNDEGARCAASDLRH